MPEGKPLCSSQKMLLSGIGGFLAAIAIIFLIPSLWMRLAMRDVIIGAIVTAGFITFFIIIYKSYSNEEFARRLDHGQIRKAIAISFTIMYIIMLATYYGGTYDKLINASPSVASGKNPYMKSETSGSGQTPGSGEAPGSAQTSGSAQTPGSADPPGSGQIPGSGEAPGSAETPGSEKIPETAITDIYKNFLYAYLIIIGFYFGSRVIEGLSDPKKLETELKYDPMRLASAKFISGEISREKYIDLVKTLNRNIILSEKEYNNIIDALDKDESIKGLVGKIKGILINYKMKEVLSDDEYSEIEKALKDKGLNQDLIDKISCMLK